MLVLMGISAELWRFRSTFSPIQEQPEDVDCSVHVPVPQRAMAFCVSTQSHTVALGSVVPTTSLCKHALQCQPVGVQQLHSWEQCQFALIHWCVFWQLTVMLVPCLVLHKSLEVSCVPKALCWLTCQNTVCAKQSVVCFVYSRAA